MDQQQPSEMLQRAGGHRRSKLITNTPTASFLLFLTTAQHGLLGSPPPSLMEGPYPTLYTSEARLLRLDRSVQTNIKVDVRHEVNVVRCSIT